MLIQAGFVYLSTCQTLPAEVEFVQLIVSPLSALPLALFNYSLFISEHFSSLSRSFSILTSFSKVFVTVAGMLVSKYLT